MPSISEMALFRLCSRALGFMPSATRATARMMGDPLSFLGNTPLTDDSVAYHLPFHTLRLINDPSVANGILTGEAGAFTPSPVMGDLLAPLAGDWVGNTFLLPPERTTPALPQIAEEASRAINHSISNWLPRNGRPAPVGADLFGLVLETLSVCLLGFRPEAETLRHFVSLQTRAMQQAQILPMLLARNTRSARAGMVQGLGLSRTGAELQALVRVHILPHLPAHAEDAPLPRYLAESGLLSTGMTDRVVAHITALLLFTSEGIAATLGWLAYELARDQLLQEGAALALDSQPVLGGEADDRFADHTPEDVLQALVLETLRLHPPFGLFLRQSEKTQEICGQIVQAGELAAISPRTLHRHRKLWSTPDAFAPERWLKPQPPPSPETVAPAVSPAAFLPFGPDMHPCPLAAPMGQEVAMAVLLPVLRGLLSSTRLVLAGGPEPRALSHLSCRAEPDIFLRVLPRPVAP